MVAISLFDGMTADGRIDAEIFPTNNTASLATALICFLPISPETQFAGSERGLMRRAISTVLVIVLVVAPMPATPTMADTLAGSSPSVLRREPQLTPAILGDGSLAGLQFANPAEQMVVELLPEILDDLTA